MSALSATLASLKAAAAEHDECLVFYSGGKDSLVITDLCVRTFKRIVAVNMYFVPGLECIERQLDYGRKRWGLKIIQYPHWLLVRCLTDGVYCPNHVKFDDLDLKLGDIYKVARLDTGIKLVATGAKKADSQWRRRNLATSSSENMLYPIVEWNKFDVLGYCKKQGIELPDSAKGNATGVDLSAPSLLWLYDHHPQDFKRLTEYFPYAEAGIKRREWYGIGVSK